MADQQPAADEQNMGETEKLRGQEPVAYEAKQRRPQRLRMILSVVVLTVVGVGALALITASATRHSAPVVPPPEGVKDVTVGERYHVEGDVDYSANPPAGGLHNPVWQNCGFYAEPVLDENAVHSMEHGAVWVTYQPNLPQEQVGMLRRLTDSHSHLLITPRQDLPAPLVASAWGKQLQLDSADDPRLEQFIRAFLQGPQTPEPGASCTGGIGQPA
ncbi:MAG: DUF3105 domain-containing protein [Egibacteraceae bacterium]